jgi:F-type H+-transporting ATPase subunit alpha
VVEQIISIFAGVRGLVDDIPVKEVQKFESGLLNFMADKHKAVMDKIAEVKKLDDELEGQVKTAIEEFKGLFKS